MFGLISHAILVSYLPYYLLSIATRRLVPRYQLEQTEYFPEAEPSGAFATSLVGASLRFEGGLSNDQMLGAMLESMLSRSTAAAMSPAELYVERYNLNGAETMKEFVALSFNGCSQGQCYDAVRSAKERQVTENDFLRQGAFTAKEDAKVLVVKEILGIVATSSASLQRNHHGQVVSYYISFSRTTTNNPFDFLPAMVEYPFDGQSHSVITYRRNFPLNLEFGG